MHLQSFATLQLQNFRYHLLAFGMILGNQALAVTDAELEALEKEIQQQEQAIEDAKQAEEQRKANAARKARQEANRKAEEEALRQEQQQAEERRLEEARRQAELQAETERREAEAKRLEEERKMKAEIEKKLQEEAERKKREAAEQKRVAAEQAVQQAKEELLAGEMVYVEGGTYSMGGTIGHWQSHDVTVDSFYIGKFEVSMDQWLQVMGNNPSKIKSCAACPVDQVSWEDAHDFIEALNRKTGANYRLPTEAEWEYACRSGGKDEVYCGGSNYDKLGWNQNNGLDKTRPMGKKTANGLGIHDMSGNLGEWVEDCWNDSYGGAPTDGSAWLSGNCITRPYRGGNWRMEYRFMKSAERLHAHRTSRVPYIGFRIVKSAN